MILAGDIGGTKTILALYHEEGAEVRQMLESTFANKDFAAFTEVLALFLKHAGGETVRIGCFGVAGPVIEGRSRMTNLSWQLEEEELARAIGAKRVKLLNDLEATAYGMLHLRPEELRILNPGAHKHTGNVAVIAAGTGLGEAMLYWDGNQYSPSPSEGGHVDFAPRTEQEIELFRYLQAKFSGRVSYERIVSGPGLLDVYRFLRHKGYESEPAWLAEELKSGDPSVTISRLGVEGGEPLCAAALELFCSIYGAEAGNLALKCLAVGGVFVGGGIAPKILPVLERGAFVRAFADKGRFSEFLADTEIKVSLNAGTALLGAARFAQRL